jgi:hypothetical protein
LWNQFGDKNGSFADDHSTMAQFDVIVIRDVTATGLHPLEIVSVAKENLGEQVGSPEEEGAKIIPALDELPTRCSVPNLNEFLRKLSDAALAL